MSTIPSSSFSKFGFSYSHFQEYEDVNQALQGDLPASNRGLEWNKQTKSFQNRGILSLAKAACSWAVSTCRRRDSDQATRRLLKQTLAYNAFMNRTKAPQVAPLQEGRITYRVLRACKEAIKTDRLLVEEAPYALRDIMERVESIDDKGALIWNSKTKQFVARGTLNTVFAGIAGIFNTAAKTIGSDSFVDTDKFARPLIFRAFLLEIKRNHNLSPAAFERIMSLFNVMLENSGGRITANRLLMVKYALNNFAELNEEIERSDRLATSASHLAPAASRPAMPSVLCPALDSNPMAFDRPLGTVDCVLVTENSGLITNAAIETDVTGVASSSAACEAESTDVPTLIYTLIQAIRHDSGMGKEGDLLYQLGRILTLCGAGNVNSHIPFLAALASSLHKTVKSYPEEHVETITLRESIVEAFGIIAAENRKLGGEAPTVLWIENSFMQLQKKDDLLIQQMGNQLSRSYQISLVIQAMNKQV